MPQPLLGEQTLAQELEVRVIGGLGHRAGLGERELDDQPFGSGRHQACQRDAAFLQRARDGTYYYYYYYYYYYLHSPKWVITVIFRKFCVFVVCIVFRAKGIN